MIKATTEGEEPVGEEMIKEEFLGGNIEGGGSNRDINGGDDGFNNE